jgi:thymidine kinase
MGAGKTLDLLKVAYNYEERGKSVVILTASIDTRSGKNKIKSRTGLEKDAISIKDDDNIVKKIYFALKDADCILVDEAQFLKRHHIHELTELVDEYNIPVICYGLRSDFKLEPFEGSMYLMAIADDIEEIKTICHCGKKATVNARIKNGKIIKDGEQIKIGGNESYISLCRKHYKQGKIKIN